MPTRAVVNGAMAMMVQPVMYRGRLVACATASRLFLADELERRPVGDPERTFVTFMCAYAGDVLRGELTGPYTDEQAQRYARAALIPEELLDPERHVGRRQRLAHTAEALGLPAVELEQAIADAARDRERSG